jgi:hypothetical protein
MDSPLYSARRQDAPVVLMTSTKRMPVDFQNTRLPKAPTLSLKNRTSARPGVK